MDKKDSKSHIIPVVPTDKVTWAHAVRDIVIKAMGRGQLPLLVFLSILLLLAFKMPDGDVTLLLSKLLEKLSQWGIWGYIIALLLIIAWSMHVRYLKGKFRREYRRISEEKSKPQGEMADVELQSSEPDEGI